MSSGAGGGAVLAAGGHGFGILARMARHRRGPENVAGSVRRWFNRRGEFVEIRTTLGAVVCRVIGGCNRLPNRRRLRCGARVRSWDCKPRQRSICPRTGGVRRWRVGRARGPVEFSPSFTITRDWTSRELLNFAVIPRPEQVVLGPPAERASALLLGLVRK